MVTARIIVGTLFVVACFILYRFVKGFSAPTTPPVKFPK